MTKLEDLMTSEQLAEVCSLPRSTVEEYARRGVLPSVKLGRHRRFFRSEVLAALEALERPTARIADH